MTRRSVPLRAASLLLAAALIVAACGRGSSTPDTTSGTTTTAAPNPDEPVIAWRECEDDAALDLAGQAHLDAAVRRRREAGDTIVIVGHDLGRLAALADSVTLLSRGRVIAHGAAETTLTAEALTRAYRVPVSFADADGRRIFWSES